MYFDSVSALLAMDGHGSYVWFSYGISALVLVWVALVPLRRGRQVRQRICAMARREQAQAGSSVRSAHSQRGEV